MQRVDPDNATAVRAAEGGSGERVRLQLMQGLKPAAVNELVSADNGDAEFASCILQRRRLVVCYGSSSS